MKRSICVCGFALLSLVASAQTKFVDVSGYRMRVKVEGSGGPTVVLDTGFGDSLEAWNPVFSAIARFTHVIAYDRAGYGESAPRPEPRSMTEIATELHQMLHDMGEPGPYVLIGHSMGGGNIRGFAHLYPKEVAGLVFVDPINEAIFASVSKKDLEQSFAQQDEMALHEGAGYRGEWKFARNEALNGMPELRSFAPLPDVPMILLIAGRGRPPGWKESEMATYGKWVSQGTEGRVIFTTESGHYIQRDEPDLVIEAAKLLVFPNVARRIRQELGASGQAAALNLARQLKRRYPVDFFPESALNSVGYEELRGKHFANAVALFKLNAEFFPQSSNVYDSLGEGYANLGDRAQAISNYKRSLQLDPHNTNAQEMLKKLDTRR